MQIPSEDLSQARIIFFDGVCHLCNSFVDHLIQADRRPRLFFFAPLQGESARKLLPATDRQGLGSVIYLDRGHRYERSEAVLRIFHDLGGLYRFSFFLRICPRFLRDAIYDWVARHRYGWFGERDFCRLPTPEEKDYLLP